MKAAALFLAAVALSACGPVSGVPPTNPPTSTPTSTTAPGPTATSAAEVDMCALMPLGDVQAKSPFQTALAMSKSMTAISGCEYRAALDAEEPVSVLLVVTTFDSAADALTALANYRQAAVDRGIPVSDVAGLGDQAFSAGSDEVGVHAVAGALEIDANMKGEWPDTTDDAKVVAGTELVRTIISRLP